MGKGGGGGEKKGLAATDPNSSRPRKEARDKHLSFLAQALDRKTWLRKKETKKEKRRTEPALLFHVTKKKKTGRLFGFLFTRVERNGKERGKNRKRGEEKGGRGGVNPAQLSHSAQWRERQSYPDYLETLGGHSSRRKKGGGGRKGGKRG